MTAKKNEEVEVVLTYEEKLVKKIEELEGNLEYLKLEFSKVGGALDFAKGALSEYQSQEDAK